MKQREGISPSRLVGPLLTKLATLDLAWAAARIARLTMHTLQSGSPSTPRASAEQWRVLLLPKAGLVDDARSTFSRIGSIEVVALPRRTIKALARAFLPREVNDNNYSSASQSARTAMTHYRAFLTRFWQALDPHQRIHAVISGNFAYYAEREFAAALEGLGVPFIALHKENCWTPGTQAFWGKIYKERRGPFLGRRILVYSPMERDLQVRSGIVDPPRIEVVGMPRLDEVHRWRVANIGVIPQPAILFASFPADVGMPVLRKGTLREGPQGFQRYTEAISKGAESLDVADLCHATHRAILQLAVACPELTVVVKTKGRVRDRTDLARFLGVRDEQDLPDNMRVVHGGSPLPLLFQSAAVCGFHSTLLLEALAAGRPVVVPWFAEALNPEIRRHVFDLGAAVTRALSPAQLMSELRRAAMTRTLMPQELSSETLRILHDWVGNEDGHAGERTAAAIRRVIETSQANRT